MAGKLIVDSGSTNASWAWINGSRKKIFHTQGISPYFLSADQIQTIIRQELKLPAGSQPDEIYYYGTGCSATANKKIVNSALKKVFPGAKVDVEHDLLGAARAVCGHDKGVVAILGTGSNSCYFNGMKIVKNSPGLGYILGDEGSGAYLGRKVLQYFLYNTFEGELIDKFIARFNTNTTEILDAVYKKPFANRYLASFAIFLAENRGHYMIENIIEDGFNTFFFNHICKYRESWTLPIHFVGSIAAGFKDVLKEMCNSYELQLGTVMKNPIDGMIKYHR